MTERRKMRVRFIILRNITNITIAVGIIDKMLVK